ncbi:MAG: minor capsid protein [Clostridia bacterium]|nr:minor capsid protein [Clostridia bacterium]
MSYWEERWASDAARAYRAAEDVIADIERIHQRALSRLQTMAKRIRRRFQMAYGLTESEAKTLLSSPIGREEYLKLLEEIAKLGDKNPMREALMAKAAAPGYAYRVSVIEGMLDEIDAVTARLAEDEQRLLEKHLRRTVKDKASRAMYQIQVEAGLGFRFNAISEELARHILRNPWSGMVFSARIWKNQDALADLLNEVLAEGLVAGNSAEEMSREIAERMSVSMSRARTLVRTETTYVCNQADAYAYDEAEIGSYRYCAVLDMRTSKVCRSLDGTVHAVRDAVPGKNYPPMHPNCRSTTRPDISEDDLHRMERWARDPVTGQGVKVPADMTYAEWLKLQEETYGEERMKIAQKMTDNKAADREQYARYQRMLGRKRLPPNLEKFQQLKYLEPEEWEKLKAEYAEEARKRRKR